MDISFDRSGPPDRFGARAAGLTATPELAGGPAPLDWPGLAARLAAAHATRQILAVGQPAHARGSFAPDAARDLAGWRAASSPGINLTPKADGKPPRTIPRNDAGDERPNVRG